MAISLVDLKKGEKAEVVNFNCGEGMMRRLEGLGIRKGKVISRVSSQLLGGPVLVSVDRRQTAMGRGMADKIIVKKLEDDN